MVRSVAPLAIHKENITECTHLAKCALVLVGQMAVCVNVAAILFFRMSNRVCTFVRLYVHLKCPVALKS